MEQRQIYGPVALFFMSWWLAICLLKIPISWHYIKRSFSISLFFSNLYILYLLVYFVFFFFSSVLQTIFFINISYPCVKTHTPSLSDYQNDRILCVMDCFHVFIDFEVCLFLVVWHVLNPFWKFFFYKHCSILWLIQDWILRIVLIII